jgi:excisionase family DNA binding protein
MTQAEYHCDASSATRPVVAEEVPWVPQIVQHLTFALTGHVRRLHVQGLTVPREVEDLASFLRHLARNRQEAAGIRQDAPPAALPGVSRQDSPMANRLLITKDEAAERLGVSVRTVERLVATGRLPQVHVERLARFRVKDLEAYVDGLGVAVTDVAETELRAAP